MRTAAPQSYWIQDTAAAICADSLCAGLEDQFAQLQVRQLISRVELELTRNAWPLGPESAYCLRHWIGHLVEALINTFPQGNRAASRLVDLLTLLDEDLQNLESTEGC